jgi:hypothetical protein
VERSTSLLERTVPSGTFVLGWTTHGAQGALVKPRMRIHLTEPMHSLLDRHMIVSSRCISRSRAAESYCTRCSMQAGSCGALTSTSRFLLQTLSLTVRTVYPICRTRMSNLVAGNFDAALHDAYILSCGRLAPTPSLPPTSATQGRLTILASEEHSIHVKSALSISSSRRDPRLPDLSDNTLVNTSNVLDARDDTLVNPGDHLLTSRFAPSRAVLAPKTSMVHFLDQAPDSARPAKRRKHMADQHLPLYKGSSAISRSVASKSVSARNSRDMPFRTRTKRIPVVAVDSAAEMHRQGRLHPSTLYICVDRSRNSSRASKRIEPPRSPAKTPNAE